MIARVQLCEQEKLDEALEERLDDIKGGVEMDDHQGAKRRDLHTSWPIKTYTIWDSGCKEYAVSVNVSAKRMQQEQNCKFLNCNESLFFVNFKI